MELSFGERQQGLRLKLINFLRNNADKGWISGLFLEELSDRWGYKPSNGARRLREMTQPEHRSFNQWVDKDTINGTIHYRWLI